MTFQEELTIFDNCVRKKGMKQSAQRKEILKAFLKTEKHMTADELFRLVQKKNPSIGVATVYRTIKLICDCGLGRELRLDKDSVRYEHLYKHDHHDHLYCVKCGVLIEVVDPEIEKLQSKLAKRNNFTMHGHRLIIHGLCNTCN